jgi:hypothetical protein
MHYSLPLQKIKFIQRARGRLAVATVQKCINNVTLDLTVVAVNPDHIQTFRVLRELWSGTRHSISL